MIDTKLKNEKIVLLIENLIIFDLFIGKSINGLILNVGEFCEKYLKTIQKPTM